MRARGQFKWQREHLPPGVRTRSEPAGQGAHGENGRGKSAVVAVTLDNRRDEMFGINPSGAVAQPTLRVINGRSIFGVRAGDSSEGGPAQSSGAEIAVAQKGVSPAAIGIDMGHKPIQTAGNQWGEPGIGM